MKEFSTDNRWSPGASGATLPDDTVAAYAGRWLDQGDYSSAQLLGDRQGFAYDDAAAREQLVTHLVAEKLQDHVGQLVTDRDVTTHVADLDRFQVYARRSGGYFYVDAWLLSGAL